MAAKPRAKQGGPEVPAPRPGPSTVRVPRPQETLEDKPKRKLRSSGKVSPPGKPLKPLTEAEGEIQSRPKKPKANSCNKGKDAEREFANLLTSLGFPAKRGQQRAGGADSPDVINLDPRLGQVHWEVKFYAQCQITRFAELDKWDAQAKRDAGQGKLPVIAHRWNGSRVWMCRVLMHRNRPFWMTLDDFLIQFGDSRHGI